MKTSTYLRIFLPIVISYGVMHIGSLFAFMYSPRTFYYRPHEYFIDIGYRVKDIPLRWHHLAYHDLTRRNFFLYQTGRILTVNFDVDGFRVRKFNDQRYPIAISGDSYIFGSGLSDHETIPWKLAERLGEPVFNAGGTTLSSTLANPALRDLRVLIDCRAERDICPDRLKIQSPAIYTPVARKDLTWGEAIAQVPPHRYSLPHLSINIGRRIIHDLMTLAGGGIKPYLFLRHTMRFDHLDQTVALVVDRKRMVEAKGIRYVFIPIPAKQTLYATNVDPYTRDFIQILLGRLSAQGVETVDLATLFQAEKGRGLFFRYDTHWNGIGTEIAADKIAHEVFGQ